MAHLYKTSTWQGSSGKWYCNDITDLSGCSAKWWVPARILGMKLSDYILLLKDIFNANICKYNSNTDVLLFFWDNQSDANKYKLWINDKAKKANFMV